MTFDTVLVANRGEIACRVIRTLKRMGLRTVAVYSDDDAGARHVREAHCAIRLGPADPRHSYLDAEAVLAACLASGAGAVHPGYGFLSENASFARLLQDNGIAFIGPGVKALELMGDKIRSKNHVSGYGVPVIPGIAEPGLSDAELMAAADSVGYPLLIKPSAGGGGKGMQAVAQPGELPAALASARRVAESAFGDDTLFLERLIQAPRHIEVQVLADTHGNVIHLGERECSLQRRHQKVIEEAPSVLLDTATRERIGEAACEAARSVDYTGAGTVEFLVSGQAPDEFFFMEMNTRLQVEHPVTEMVTGIDLVEWQVRIAAGEVLDLSQQDVQLTGHAVEARVYAEDPAQGFLPTAGTVELLAEVQGEGIRTDSGLVQGQRVSSSYDPMLAKVIAWGPDRQSALARLDAALADTVILGIGTNIEYLRLLLADDDVQAGELDTTLIERRLPGLRFRSADDVELAAAGLLRLAVLQEKGQPSPSDGSPWHGSPWYRADGWRLGGTRPLSVAVAAGGTAHTVEITGTPQAARVRIDGGAPLTASLESEPGAGAGQARLALDGVVHSLRFAHTPGSPETGAELWTSRGGYTAVLGLPDRKQRLRARLAASGRVEGAADPVLRSPMPGTVVTVAVQDGDAVDAGQVLLSVEAMKMEHQLTAPLAGRVSISLRTGDLVKAGQVLASVTPAEAAQDGSDPATPAPPTEGAGHARI
ncbi:acetyl/propionyl/methylcrotonyl-CoA carboxylase subunit alpha [Arthrobacter caoxuetaonis]|uniref:acetyl/propionyl/methylcrotonyl-CoA carboxylase subunit alpha n=1 Tax=Arthrobacter caoxuetaonis TaxID=2886935 RepID=UPI001D144EA5|nr:biotin carboxylase N-terminal domain-containing protein [Arthrobacter caoxuetaonis]MCC3283913.1 biotin/lipoyl-binding protein [Arthrobacter caoxuetaonis]